MRTIIISYDLSFPGLNEVKKGLRNGTIFKFVPKIMVDVENEILYLVIVVGAFTSVEHRNLCGSPDPGVSRKMSKLERALIPLGVGSMGGGQMNMERGVLRFFGSSHSLGDFDRKVMAKMNRADLMNVTGAKKIEVEPLSM